MSPKRLPAAKTQEREREKAHRPSQCVQRHRDRQMDSLPRIQQQPRINARLQELDRMRSRTQRIRREFFERRRDPDFMQTYAKYSSGASAANDPVYGTISNREKRFLKPSHIQHPDPCLGDLKYYTEMTLRPPRQEFKFNALNRNSVPHPEWNTPRPDSSQYRTTDMKDWEAEVIKPPLAPMSYSLPMRVKTPKVSEEGAADWNVTMRTMFRPVDRFDVPSREYMVDPEWVSEDERIAQARAARLMQSRAV